jgi:hypothetical protein
MSAINIFCTLPKSVNALLCGFPPPPKWSTPKFLHGPNSIQIVSRPNIPQIVCYVPDMTITASTKCTSRANSICRFCQPNSDWWENRKTPSAGIDITSALVPGKCLGYLFSNPRLQKIIRRR